MKQNDRKQVIWGHMLQYTDDASYNYTLETRVILLTNVTPVHLIKKKSDVCWIGWEPRGTDQEKTL